MGIGHQDTLAAQGRDTMSESYSAAAKPNNFTASMEAGYRGTFRDPRFGEQPLSLTQEHKRFADYANKEEGRVMGPPISHRGGGGFATQSSTDKAVRMTGTMETSGLNRSLPTNIGDVRPIHVNNNSLRNTTASRYSCDTLCGNWNEERRDTGAQKVAGDAVLRKGVSSHIYQSEYNAASAPVEATRKPTAILIEDEVERLTTTTNAFHTNMYQTERNEKTLEAEEVFPETDALRDYRSKWTSRPLIKKTEHTNAYQNWHQRPTSSGTAYLGQIS